MRRITVFSVLVSALVLAVLLVPGLTRAQPAAQDMNITLAEFMFTPNSFTVTQGQVVHISVTNAGKFPHSVSFTQNGKFLTVFAQPIAGGKTGSADFVFPTSGTWEMYCPVSNHAERGMIGSVQVLSAVGPGMPSTGMPGDQALILAALLGLFLVGNGLLLRRRRAARLG